MSELFNDQMEFVAQLVGMSATESFEFVALEVIPHAFIEIEFVSSGA